MRSRMMPGGLNSWDSRASFAFIRIRLNPVHVIFTPTTEEISFARRVVDAFEAEAACGVGRHPGGWEVCRLSGCGAIPQNFAGWHPESPGCKS